MSRSMFQAVTACPAGVGVIAPIALCTLLLPSMGGAEPLLGAPRSTGHFEVRLAVRPVFKVLEVTPVKDGFEYRVWTNARSIVIGGREYLFDKVGETVLKVDGRQSDIDKQLDADRNRGIAWRSNARAGADASAGPAIGSGSGGPTPTEGTTDLHTVTVTY